MAQPLPYLISSHSCFPCHRAWLMQPPVYPACWTGSFYAITHCQSFSYVVGHPPMSSHDSQLFHAPAPVSMPLLVANSFPQTHATAVLSMPLPIATPIHSHPSYATFPCHFSMPLFHATFPCQIFLL